MASRRISFAAIFASLVLVLGWTVYKWTGTRLVMFEAARRQEVEPDRISFIDVLRLLTHARPGQPLRRVKVHVFAIALNRGFAREGRKSIH